MESETENKKCVVKHSISKFDDMDLDYLHCPCPCQHRQLLSDIEKLNFRLSYDELIIAALQNDGLAIKWLQQHKLLPSTMTCYMENCKSTMIWSRHNASADGFCWRCPKSSCRRLVSIRKKSFFESSHLKLTTLVKFIYLWCLGRLTGDEMGEQLELASPKTIMDWKNMIRNVCAEYLNKNPVVVGGPGTEVEISMQTFGLKKNIDGDKKKKSWKHSVIGGFERGTGRCFLIDIDPQYLDSNVLVKVMRNHIYPNTTVILHDWGLFSNIEEALNEPENGLTNHQIAIVTPPQGLRMQATDSLWRALKEHYRSIRGTSLFTSFLVEFMWRRMFGLNGVKNTFHNLLCQIINQYPVPENSMLTK